MAPGAHTSTDVPPGDRPLRLLFEPVAATTGSGGKIGFGDGKPFISRRLARAGSPGAARLPVPARMPVYGAGQNTSAAPRKRQDGSGFTRHSRRQFPLRPYKDSQLVAASLQIWAAHGVNEALAAPILS